MATLNIEESTLALKAGNVIAYPTEGVWGLGCDPFNEKAVNALLRLKQRKKEKGLILLSANTDQLKPYLDLNDADLERLRPPQTTTFLVPFKASAIPHWIIGKHPLLAVRVSRHPTVKKLCMLFNHPIISTSANASGAEAAKTASEVADYFPNVLICQGETGRDTKPSRIVNFNTGQVIRN